MPSGSRVCPECGGLNGPKEVRCYRCGQRLPGPLAAWMKSAFGGELVVTRGLVFACLLVFALAVVSDGSFPVAPELGIGKSFRVSTWARFGALFPPAMGYEPWQLLSAVFFHFSALHIGFNSLGLVQFGRPLEQRFGPARALLLFLAAGVAGFVTSQWWYGAIGPMTGGASGGVFGQLGGVIGVVMARKQPGWKDMLIQNLVFALMMGFFLRVNTAAHLGGFVVGFALGYLFEREGRRRALTPIFGALAVAGALASVGSLVASMGSPLWREIRQHEVLRDG